MMQTDRYGIHRDADMRITGIGPRGCGRSGCRSREAGGVVQPRAEGQEPGILKSEDRKGWTFQLKKRQFTLFSFVPRGPLMDRIPSHIAEGDL